MDMDTVSALFVVVPLSLWAPALMGLAIRNLLDRWLTHQETMARILAGLDTKGTRRKA